MSAITTRYWMAVACQDHVKIGVQEGFAQACHGKKNPLGKMSQGDWIIYYSPTQQFKGKTKLKSFTAIGEIADKNIYQVEMAPSFKPFRRNVTFIKTKEIVPIASLLEKLELTMGNKHWGIKFRSGLFQITQNDFFIIENAFKNKEKEKC